MVFFFSRLLNCFATKIQIAYAAYKAPVIWPTKNNFPYLLLALLSDLERLQLKGWHIALKALHRYSTCSRYTLTALAPLQNL